MIFKIIRKISIPISIFLKIFQNFSEMYPRFFQKIFSDFSLIIKFFVIESINNQSDCVLDTRKSGGKSNLWIPSSQKAFLPCGAQAAGQLAAIFAVTAAWHDAKHAALPLVASTPLKVALIRDLWTFNFWRNFDFSKIVWSWSGPTSLKFCRSWSGQVRDFRNFLLLVLNFSTFVGPLIPGYYWSW